MKSRQTIIGFYILLNIYSTELSALKNQGSTGVGSSSRTSYPHESKNFECILIIMSFVTARI